MSQCTVQRCTGEATEFLPLIGPVCVEHLETLPNTEWVLEGTEQSATGRAGPMILTGESLRALDEYVLLEVPTEVGQDRAMRMFNPPEGEVMRVPIRVRRRGDEERTITLVIPTALYGGLAEFFSDSYKFYVSQGE